MAIYSAFASQGAAPSAEALAEVAGSVSEANDAITALAARRHLVLDERGTIVLAHPFASVSFGFSVMGRDTLWWGGCAWDSFAIPHLVTAEPSVLVATTCPHCGRALSWVVNRDRAPEGADVAHFLVPAHHMWDDVVHTCSHQRIFCSPEHVDAWLAATGYERGYVMNLMTLWNLAQHWYDGRMDSGYVRREPDQAKAYFRAVGLTGPFWD